MDIKKRLEEIDENIGKINKEIEQLKMDFMGHDMFEEYDAYNEEDKAEKYPELFKLQKRIEELEASKDPLIEEEETLEQELEEETRINEGKQKYNEIVEKQKSLEDEIAHKAKLVDEALKEIQDINKQVYDLKETEEYKKGEPETLAKVAELESTMQKKILAKNEIVKSLREMRSTINELEEKKEAIIKEYGKEIVPKINEDKKPEKKKEIEEAVEEETKPKQTAKPKAERKSAAKERKHDAENRSAYSVGTTSSGYEEPAVNFGDTVVEKADEERDKEITKAQFKELRTKAKKGALDEGEFNKIVAIMKNPESYDKYGITTGVIFNNSKKIFKSLEKSVGNIDSLSIQVKLAFAKELVVGTDGKELLSKIAALESEGLTTDQQELRNKAKLTLNRQEVLEQAKYVRDTVALAKNEKRWSWLIDFGEDKQRLAAASAERVQPEKPSGGVDMRALVKPETEQLDAYAKPVGPVKPETERKQETII